MNMRRNIRKSNQKFMWRVMAMAVAVLVVMYLFWLLCLPQK